MSKKQQIIDHAVSLFNQKGYAAVTLFELANELSMSRGNLTYHFKDKEMLLGVIAQQMWDQIELERSKSRQLPSFENLQSEVHLYYKYQRQYKFIFTDPHVLKHKIIVKQFRQMTSQSIADIKASIAFSVELGNMRPESYPGLYNNMALTTWMLTFFWLPQQVIRGEKTTEDGDRMIWSLVLPHMTEKGLASFKKFFGEEVLHNLGEPFNLDIDSLVRI